MAILYGKIAVFAVLLAGIRACSPPVGGYREPTKAQSVGYANSVLWGRIERTFPHRFFSTAYTAQMKVYCVLKGHITASVVNITAAGFVPGRCFATTLEPGNEYVALLFYSEENDRFIPNRAYPSSDLLAVAGTCGLQPTYPLDVTNSTYPDKQCPTAPDPDNCVSARKR